MTRLDCTASAVGQGPVIFVGIGPADLVAEELRSVLASQQPMVLVAVEHVAAVAEMFASVFAYVVVPSNAAGVKGCSSYWSLT